MGDAIMRRGGWAATAATVIVSSLSCAARPSLASNYNYYYDANGHLIASTRIQGLNESYGYDSADNRSSFNTGHQNTPTTQAKMYVNQGLTRYQSVTSRDGRFFLTLQDDGNAVLYQNGAGALWGTNTLGKQSSSFGLQADGNLVLRDAYGNGIWSSNTSGHPNASLSVQNDGNVVLYDGSTSIWSTNTCCH